MTSMLRQWRLSAIAIMIVLAALASAINATAATAAEPGEDPDWRAQTYNDGHTDQIIESPDTMSESITNPGPAVHRVRVWRGYDDDVWISVDGGLSFPPTVGHAVTHVAPRIVWDGTRMTIYHTGTNGYVFISTNSDIDRLDNAFHWSPCSQIGVPNLRTRQSVSVVHLTGHGTQAYITWRGYDNYHIYGAFYDGIWGLPSRISNGYSWYAATLTWNQSRQRLFAFIAGYYTQQIFYAYQNYGDAGWTNFSQLGSTPLASLGSPAAATLANGDMEIAYTGADSQIYHGWWPRLANFNNWARATGRLESNVAPFVIAIGTWAYLEANRRGVNGRRDQVNFKSGLRR
jgi:hypothetical protein